MAEEQVLAETTVTGTSTRIPDRVRTELDIEDGDTLRWHVVGGEVHLTVVGQRRVTFADFDGYTGPKPTDVTREHDEWGLE